MAIVTIIMPETFVPADIARNFEETSHVKVTNLVLRSDGKIDIHYEEIEREDRDAPLLKAIQTAFDALSDIEIMAKERSRERVRKVNRRYGSWD